MVETVDAATVRRRLAEGALLVNVLPEEQFAAKRIPGSVSAPIDSPGFEARIRGLAPDPDRPIIVHCSSAACPASANAARRLEAMGYRDVHHFKDGLEGWAKAGFDFEAGGGRARPSGSERRRDRPKQASTGLPLTGRSQP